MLVRYFAAACAAAGVEEEDHPLPEGTSLETLLAAVLLVQARNLRQERRPSRAYCSDAAS